MDIRQKSYHLLVATALLLPLSVCAKDKPSVVNIQQWQTSQGTTVSFVELHEMPMVDVRVVFAAGSSFDGDKPGLASMVNAMMSEGTATMNADQIAEAFDNVGSQYQNTVDRDFASVGFRSLSNAKYLQKTMTTFTDLLTHPNFAEKSFQRVKNQTLVGLQYQQQVPTQIASKALFKALYGNQPYGHPTYGDIASVTNMKRDTLATFY
ncbi:MAG: insulinase family protein [Coxiellaceae bacterium]|nr:insulinase family protein [Coxiellaceae bacterium]